MSLYSHLKLSHARKLIILANKGISRYQVGKITGISQGKIRRCLNACEKITRTKNLSKPWKSFRINKTYSFRIYKNQRDQQKLNNAYNHARDAEKVYCSFINFCHKLYETRILGKKVKRSALEFIKEFKGKFPSEPCPSKSWVYYMASSIHYQFRKQWLPIKKKEKFYLKSDDERKKPEKYMPIDKRPPKEELRSYAGNFEIDSLIGKRTDKQAMLTLIDIHNGNFYSRFYNRTMLGFMQALKWIIKKDNIDIKSLTMDNGGENNLLYKILPKEIMFNCQPYCSGEKGTLENKHRIVRRIFHKSESLDKYTNEDIQIVNQFVNSYYSKKFNKL